MLLLDICNLFAGVSCVESEILMQRMMAFSFVYVGGLYAMLTYHNKDKPPKITRLTNMALNAATAMLVSVVFIGNAKYGGFERSWMHIGDMWTVSHPSYHIYIFVVLSLRSQTLTIFFAPDVDSSLCSC